MNGTKESFVSRLPSSVSRLSVPVLFLHLAALALAFAPPVFFGAAVAPAAFRLLPTRDLAAALVSPILSKACLLAEISFAVLFMTSLFLTRKDAPRLTKVLLTRLSLFGFFAAIVIRQLLIPPMDKIREEAPGLIDTLPASDPSRLLLDRYHRLTSGLLAAEVVAALVMLLLTARLLAARRASPAWPAAAPPPVPKLLDLSGV